MFYANFLILRKKDVHKNLVLYLMIWFNSLPKESHMIAFPNTSPRTQENKTGFIVFHLRCKSFVLQVASQIAASSILITDIFRQFHRK